MIEMLVSLEFLIVILILCSIPWRCVHCNGSGINNTGCCPHCGGTGKITITKLL